LIALVLLVLTVALFSAGCADTSDPAAAGDDPAVERSYEETGDLDCDEVSYDEAQGLLEDGDPHGLDRDGDGEACEANR